MACRVSAESKVLLVQWRSRQPKNTPTKTPGNAGNKVKNVLLVQSRTHKEGKFSVAGIE